MCLAVTAAVSFRPPHAYVPGETPRHPEALFDRFKTTGRNLSAEELMNAKAWPLGLALLHERYFWESHEVLESIWFSAKLNSPERGLTQGLIQMANAGLKFKMHQPKAGLRLLVMADELIAESARRGGLQLMALDRHAVQIMRGVAAGDST